MSRAKTVGATEAAKILGVTPVWVYKLRESGKLDAELIHGYWRFRLSSVQKLNRQRAAAGRKRND